VIGDNVNARATAVKLYLIDLGERCLWTFLEAFGAALILAGTLDLDVVKTAALAGVAAVIALVKGLGAKLVGDRNSASTAPQIATHQAPSSA
jgi:hypothetical protein